VLTEEACLGVAGTWSWSHLRLLRAFWALTLVLISDLSSRPLFSKFGGVSLRTFVNHDVDVIHRLLLLLLTLCPVLFLLFLFVVWCFDDDAGLQQFLIILVIIAFLLLIAYKFEKRARF
jgi:fatty acid desaturase